MDLLDEYLKEFQVDITDYSLAIGVGYDYEEAKEFKKMLIKFLEERGQKVEDIPLYQIGAAIGVHTGPYALGIGIMKRHGL